MELHDLMSRLVSILIVIQTASATSVNCRLPSGRRVTLDYFKLETCAKCYSYLPDWAFKDGQKLFHLDSGIFYDHRINSTILSNETDALSSTFATPHLVEKWRRCCLDAIDCCLNHLSDPHDQHHFPDDGVNDSTLIRSQDDPDFCPRTWDGWTCWKDDVPKGQIVRQSCPDHIYWKITAPPCRGYVTKSCTQSGWFLKDGREWSNYTICARDDIYVRRLRYSIITNVMSVSFIIPALVIFNCYRIRLHKHLFSCLLIYAILSSLLKMNLLFNRSHQDGSRSPSSRLYCLILSLSLRYFRSSTYLCMFNEAFYLYQLIKKAFHAPTITPLVVIAYLVPAVMTSTYIIARAVQVADNSITDNSTNGTSVEGDSSKDADPCWMLPDRHAWKEWLINGPNLAMLMINSFLIIPIVREIYKKATSMPLPAPPRLVSTPSPGHNQGNQDFEVNRPLNQDDSMSSSRKKSHLLILSRSESILSNSTEKKVLSPSTTVKVSSGSTFTKASFLVSLRAATLLLPLYGLHYLVIVYRPDVDICWMSEMYHYLSLTLDGLQGCLVSILFCFGNNEVRQLLKRSFTTRRGRSDLYMTQVVGGGPSPQPTSRRQEVVT